MGFLDRFLKPENAQPQNNRHARNNTVCPYCGTELEKSPKRKTKCPHCGKEIYYRGTQSLFPSVLLTEAQANAADEYKNFIYTAQEHGFGDNCYQDEHNALKAKFGKEPGPGDVIWSLYNKLILKIKDPGRLKGIYYSMALFLNKEGKDHNQVLGQSIRMDLESYRAAGYTNFEVYSKDGCSNCKKLHKTKLIYEQAAKLETLPCKDCSTVIFIGKKPFCRCSYSPL